MARMIHMTLIRLNMDHYHAILIHVLTQRPWLHPIEQFYDTYIGTSYVDISFKRRPINFCYESCKKEESSKHRFAMWHDTLIYVMPYYAKLLICFRNIYIQFGPYGVPLNSNEFICSKWKSGIRVKHPFEQNLFILTIDVRWRSLIYTAMYKQYCILCI